MMNIKCFELAWRWKAGLFVIKSRIATVGMCICGWECMRQRDDGGFNELRIDESCLSTVSNESNDVSRPNVRTSPHLESTGLRIQVSKPSVPLRQPAVALSSGCLIMSGGWQYRHECHNATAALML